MWHEAGDEAVRAGIAMYGVSPESEGLVAYWKFNEGSGSTIIDHANGTNLSAVGGTPTWIPVTLPEVK